MAPSPGSSVNYHIQRTKSTTSVKERRKHPLLAESIDPHTAHTHALIAAHRAVDRSRASASTELSRSESVLSKKTSSIRKEQSVTFSPATHLRQQRSTLQKRIPRSAERVPREACGLEGDHLSYLGLGVEFGYEGENYGAEPSSYRKLRHTKSLFTPVRRGQRTQSRSPETIHSNSNSLRTSISSTTLRPPSFQVRLKKSFNFLRSAHPRSDRVVTAPAQIQSGDTNRAAVVALARTQYAQDLSQRQDSARKSSILNISRAGKAQKVFRKSLRTTHASEVGAKDSAPSNDSLTSARLEKRAVSDTLSGKFKSMFRRSKQHQCVPPQQLEASKLHFGPDFKNPESGFDNYLEPESGSTRQIRPDMPSTLDSDIYEDDVKVCRQLDHSGSSESLSSISKSRVTSWTNSTGSGSIAMRLPVHEANRLSIIKEDGGPHQPSSSMGRHMAGVSAFQQPIDLPEGQKIDSQRIYSALLKRIDDEQTQMEKTQTELTEIHAAREQDDSAGHHLFSVPTIRRVGSKGSVTLANIIELNAEPACKTVPRIECQTQRDAAYQSRGLAVEERFQQPEIRSGLCQLSADHDIDGPGPGPLWRARAEKQSRRTFETSRESGSEIDSIIVGSTGPYRHSSNSKFISSTDSVYSRTTNGGTNADYKSPVASTESFHRPALQAVNVMSILDARCSRDLPVIAANQPAGRAILAQGSLLHGHKPWVNRMENGMHILEPSKSGLRRSMHVREHAQFDSDDTEVGNFVAKPRSSPTVVTQLDDKLPLGPIQDVNASLNGRNHPRAAIQIREKSSTVLQHQKGPQKNTSAPTQIVSLKRSQSALLNQSNKTESDQIEGHKFSRLRRISSSSILNVIKTRRSQPAFQRYRKFGKENRAIDSDQPLPTSTPSPRQVQMQEGGLSERYRNSRNMVDSLREKQDCTRSNRYDSFDENRLNYSESLFPPRLRSKPFDIDTPRSDRPLDSTFLDQCGTVGDNQLSIAVIHRVDRRKKTYGDLGPPPFAMQERQEDDDGGEVTATTPTALPALPLNDRSHRSVSSLSLSKAKRGIVGTILGRRRAVDEHGRRSRTGSPAFL